MLLLPRSSGAGGGERLFSPPLHCVIGLAPVSCLGPACRVPPRRGGWRSKPPGSCRKGRTSRGLLLVRVAPEGMEPGCKVSNKRVSPSLSFPLTDFSHTALFAPGWEHSPPPPPPPPRELHHTSSPLVHHPFIAGA